MSDELDCIVYADGDAEALAPLLDGVDFYLDANDEYDPVRRAEFPDGFLFFRYLIELTEGEATTRRVLQRLWDAGIPAVAACDYEDRLPEAGGYKSRAVPWPQPR